MRNKFSKRIFLVATALFVTPLFSWAAWTEPLSAPTDGNTEQPINVGYSGQVKYGGLIVGANSGLDQEIDPEHPGVTYTGLNVLYGSVGIGLPIGTLPTSKMEVAGIVTADGFCYRGGGCVSAGGGASGGTTNFLARWLTQDTLGASLIYDNGTNVGVGPSFSETNEPTALLHVDDNTTEPIARPMIKITREQSLPGVAGLDRANAGLYILTRDYPLNVEVYDSGATGGTRPALTVTGDGRVGINNATPVADLDVAGTIAAYNLFFNQGGWTFNDSTGLGQWLRISSVNNGGLELDKLQVNGQANFSTNVGVTGDVTATSFCFQGTSICLTKDQPGGGSVGPGTVGYLPKFTSETTIGDSVVAENNGRVGVGVGLPGASSQVKLDVQNSMSGGAGVFGYGYIGVNGITNVAGGIGVRGEDSMAGAVGRGVAGVSYNASGIGVYGSASGSGGTGGSFVGPSTGYALKTGAGSVYLDGNVGVGSDPLVDWPTDAKLPSGESTGDPAEALKMRVSGPMGATYYCDENGMNCLTPAELGANYWTYDTDTNAIFSNNPSNGNPGTGVVGVGIRPSSTFNKFNALTNNGENIAVKGESSKNGGIGVYGNATNFSNGYGVTGKATGDSGVGGYFYVDGNAYTAGTGYALQTGTGLVQFGGASSKGIVGIGAAPASWETDGSRNSLQLLTHGNVGASAYCLEDGTGCISTSAIKRSYWSLNPATGDIFNINPTVRVGIGGTDPKSLGTNQPSLDVRGPVYVDQLCIKTSATDATTQCASTWEEMASILFQ